MTRTLPESLQDVEPYGLWTMNRRFLPMAYRVSQSESKGSHFGGGKVRHDGARCAGCDHILTLLWDLDLTDNTLPRYARRAFEPATRIPLYVCWNCAASTYCVVSDQQIECFPFDEYSECLGKDESPFVDAPIELDSWFLGFERVPTTVDAVLSLSNVIGLAVLDSAARGQINEFYRQEMDDVWDLPFSQLGGEPMFYQRRRDRVCPNLKCPASKLTPPYGVDDFYGNFLMKELALIHWKDTPILEEHCFQMLYYVCAICASIRGEYRCS